MFNDFQCGIEYYHNVNTNICELYGLNLWSGWCYGSANHQIHTDVIQVGNEKADVWGMNGNDFVFTNVRSKCTPVSKMRKTSGEATFYYNMATSLPADYFSLPQSCVDAVNAAGIDCSKGTKQNFNLQLNNHTTVSKRLHGLF